MTVAGYEIGRDERGLTRREHEVLAGMKAQKSFAQIGAELGITKQRVGQIAKSLVRKGFLVYGENGYGVPLKG